MAIASNRGESSGGKVVPIFGASIVVLASCICLMHLRVAFFLSNHLADWYRYSLSSDGVPMEIWGSRFTVGIAEGFVAIALISAMVSVPACMLTAKMRWLFRFSVAMAVGDWIFCAAFTLYLVLNMLTRGAQ
jgi:hypothetical protein